MADSIGALLGLYSDPKKDPSALAHQLRGQQEMGNFYGLSSIGEVSDYGKSLRKNALATAGATGKARTAAEKQAYDRAYQTGRDTRADSVSDRAHLFSKTKNAQTVARNARLDARSLRKEDEDRNKFTDPKRYINKKTGEEIITYSNSAGRRVNSEGDQIRGSDLKGFTEVVKPSSRSGGFGARESTDEFDNATLIISDGQGGYKTVYASDPSQEVNPAIGKAMAEISAGASGRKALSKSAMKERGAKAIPAARTARSRIRSTEGAYRNVLNAVRNGEPLTGTLINKLGVTLRDVTAQVEQGRAQAGLAGISEHTFGSLSEGERMWLLDTAININKDPKLIVLDMEKKLKGLELLREAKDLEMRELRRGTPDEVIAEMVDDVYGDFTFEDATVGGEDPEAAKARIESGGSLNDPVAPTGAGLAPDIEQMLQDAGVQ